MPAPQTIFVASLPASASNERLEEIFSEVGPVKQCFVVREKGTETCRGFGYVTYALEEDSQQAMKTIKDYDGQRISLSVAKQKIKDKKKPAKPPATEPGTEPAKEPAKVPAKVPVKVPAKVPAKVPVKVPAKVPVKVPAKVPAKVPGKEPAKVTAKVPAEVPVKALAPKVTEEGSKGFRKSLLKAKLIIRNLSFKCSEDDLKKVFSEFGTVLESKIPLKPDGKMRGFAFVLFKNVSQAAKALQSMNLKEIKGRQVAVDWAIPKDKYLATQQSSSAGNKTTEAATVKPSDPKSEPEEEEEEEQEEEEEEEETKPKPAPPSKKKVASKPAVQQVEESQSEDEDDEEEEQDSEEEEEEEDDDDDDDDDDDNDDDNDDEEDDHDDGSSHDSNESQDEDDEESEEEKEAKRKAKNKLLPSDVKEGKTIFIRNLSFDTEEEGLEEVLLKYGELNYIKIVLHPDTDHSKGCAFAQFKIKECADKCIAAAEDQAENGGVRLDGRKLLIVAAVTREDASKLKVDKVKVESGTRNLYLAREGLIRAGTKAAEGVPEADMIKRTRFEEIKRTKLRDIGVFVSKNRLCIHNLPKSVDDKKLRALCLEAIKGQKGVRIPECRVMYDRKPEKGKPMGQSLGYGFVQFQDHEYALKTLRHLNNNPDIFGSHKRPVVEFSLEDSRKLKMKELRQQKNKQSTQNRPYQGGAKPQAAAGGQGPRGGGSKPQSSSELGGKESAPAQNQKKDKLFSGFQTKPEVEHVSLENGKKRKKVLHLPSHRGPKIRLRDKGKQQGPPPKKVKPNSTRKEPQRKEPQRQMEKPMQSRSQIKAAKKPFRRDGDGDRFDSLVEQYKKKLIGNSDKSSNVKRNKWFNS